LKVRVLPLEPAFSEDLKKAEAQNLPLVIPPEVVQALATAGQALLAAASALQGKTLQTTLPKAVNTSPALTVFPDAITVIEVANELLRQKARLGRDDDYLRVLRGHLKKFAQATQNAALAAVPAPRIEKWIDGLKVNGKTRRGHLNSIRLLYNFALKRGYVNSNPAMAVELPGAESRAPEIHSPAQVRHVLETIRRVDLGLCRFLAIRYFAGLRASEAQGCKVELERGFIEVTAAVAKTRKRRLVTIHPNLAEWLKLGGELPLRQLHNKVASIKRRTGVPWSANVTRHSFCSYHLAHWRKASETAMEAGHSEAILFREVVTREDAAEFWAIVPS
jgi:integrase